MKAPASGRQDGPEVTASRVDVRIEGKRLALRDCTSI